MINYRPYRNTDPPAIMEVWNECAQSRGTFPIRTVGVFERWLYCKPYFEPPAMIIAEETIEDDTRRVIGFSLAGFAPNEEQTELNLADGIIAAIMVRPAVRRRGIGTELLRRANQYLKSHGALSISIGSQWPRNPYLLGLYGGSNSPGILDSSTEARPFLEAAGFEPAESVVVFQRKLDTPLGVPDSRFSMLRRRYDIQLLKAAVVGTWWQECQWSAIEPAEFRVIDKLTGLPAARAIAWELEGFSWRWGYPSAGIVDVQVRPDLRRQGLAKLLVTHILRFLQDQFFGICELQVRSDDEAAIGLCKSLDFEVVDTGHVYRIPASLGDQTLPQEVPAL